MEAQQVIVKQSPLVGFSIFSFIWKYKFWILLLLFTIPIIADSIRVGVETHNPTYPFFDLATRILGADAQLGKDVQTLEEDPSKLIGMPKPEAGIWKMIVFYWHLFFNVIWKMAGSIWFTFLPLLIIYKLLTPRETGQYYKNILSSIFIFLGYLFVTNTIILLHDVIVGTQVIKIPEGYDNFKAYFYLFLLTLPFHGLVKLGIFLVNLFI